MESEQGTSEQQTRPQDQVAASMLTLAHMIRKGEGERSYEKEYAHDHVVEEYETWLGYVSGHGEPISPHG